VSSSNPAAFFQAGAETWSNIEMETGCWSYPIQTVLYPIPMEEVSGTELTAGAVAGEKGFDGRGRYDVS